MSLFNEGNEWSYLTVSKEEHYAFDARAKEQRISPSQLWMNIITDNGRVPIKRILCEKSENNESICDDHCNDEDCPWLRERGIERSERSK